MNRYEYLQSVRLFAPAINLHYTEKDNPIFKTLKDEEYDLTNFVGSISPVIVLYAMGLVNTIRCLSDKIKDNSCGNPYDPSYGLGGNQFWPKWGIKYFNYVSTSSSGELAQLLQSGQRNEIRYFEYRNPIKNIHRYGSPNVPSYNLSAINVPNLSVWTGNTDRIANKINTKTFVDQLKGKCSQVECH